MNYTDLIIGLIGIGMLIINSELLKIFILFCFLYFIFNSAIEESPKSPNTNSQHTCLGENKDLSLVGGSIPSADTLSKSEKEVKDRIN